MQQDHAVEASPMSPTCPQCARAPTVPPPQSRSVERLNERVQIYEATGGLPTTDETHAVGRLVAVYTVQHLIGCALPDRTAHRDGYIILTA